MSCTKAARFDTHAAAMRQARYVERELGEPYGAMEAYLCHQHTGWHVGRRKGYHRFVEMAEHRAHDYLATEAARMELGDRVIAWGRRENLGSPWSRFRAITHHATTWVRLRRREAA